MQIGSFLMTAIKIIASKGVKMLQASKENVMSAISALGFTVFRSGQFHWNSSETPDMLINQNGTIHCWTNSPFQGGLESHGDLIDFLRLNSSMSFKDAKKEAYRLLNIPIPPLDSYKDDGFSSNSAVKTGYISENFIDNFEIERKDNFPRFMELLNQALPSLNFKAQKKVAKKYKIGYSKKADRLIMPIRDEHNQCRTLWKYNKNPKSFLNDKGDLIKPSKVTFTKSRKRCPFNMYDFINYTKDKEQWIFLCAGEKDVLNAVGNGLRAITLGSENMSISSEHINLFKGLKIVIAYDYDDPGIEGAKKIANQLKNITYKVKVIDWPTFLASKNIDASYLKKGFDVTDYLVIKNQK